MEGYRTVMSGQQLDRQISVTGAHLAELDLSSMVSNYFGRPPALPWNNRSCNIPSLVQHSLWR